MKQSTTFAQVATILLNVLQGYSKSIRLLLVMFLTLTVSTAWGADVTISVSSDTWTETGTSGSGGATKVSKDGITVSSNKGYKDGSTAIREYSGGTITVSSSSNITKIVFTSTANKGSKYGPDCIALKSGSAGTYTTSSNSNLGTWTGTAKSITFTCSAQFRWKQVVVTTESSHTVTWTINPAAGGSLSPTSGTSTTVTPNVAYTYDSPAYTVTPAGKANVSQDGDNFTATPSANCTIQINMVAKPKYTVNWYVNETKEHSQIDIAGTTLTNIPDLKDYECGGKVFVGWTTQPSYEHATDAPNDLITNTTGMTIPENGEDYYAVFAESGGTPTTTWSKTDIANIKSTDEVVITMSNGVTTWALRNEYGTSEAPYAESITITNEQISSKVGDVQIWNISNSSGNLTIYPKGKTTTWLYCTNTNDGVRVGTNANKTFTISGNYLKHTGTSRYVGVYTTNPDWRCYTSTTGNSNIAGQTLAFYKKTTTGGYQNYTTECSTPTEFTVSFDANGHGTAPNAQTVASGQQATEPTPAPTATGYTFGGWYKESECENKFDFNTAITADITLYAKWTPITYTVSFDNNGGTGTMGSQTLTYNQAQTLTANTFTRTGYTFSGWNTKSDGSGDSYTNSQSVKNLASTNGATITLYAQWKIQTFTVVFDKNGGTGTMASQIFTYNQAQTLTANTFTRTGYTFSGWNTKSDGSGNSYTDKQSITLTTAGLTLYAQWKANTYTVAFNANGGTGSMSNQSFTYGQSQSLTANAFTRTNYAFKNWNTKADGSGTNYTDKHSVSNLTTTNGETVTLYAQWTPTYTITWLANGQEFHKQENAVEGTALDVPDSELDASEYACDDKVFVGWTATQIDGSTDTEPADLFKSKTDKVENAATTYYAVFAMEREDGVGTTEIVKTETFSNQTSHASESIWQQSLTWDATESNIGVEWSTYYGKILANDDYVEIRTYSNKNMGYIWSSQKIKGLKSIQFNGWHVTESDAADMVVSYSKNNDNDWVEIGTHTAGSTSSSQSAVFTIPDAGVNDEYYISIDLSNATCPSSSNKKYRIDNISLTILEGSGSTISYSNYSTTCVKLPDPVLSFETEPANPIVFTDAVCGGNSSKQSVTVVGENLRDVVNVSVTGPYKIARTASTALKDFTPSLTLDKTAAGAIHSNYQTVYIISTPPAQSTEATTGTLTFTTTKGNTLTVNLSTPTVTCTQYTLTLVDRGVSTEQPTKYYAGETIDEAPTDPEGVCTDPIHYVFDGWAEATVAEGSTEYTKVTFPYTVTGNTKFYAVYRYVEDGVADSGDYVKVTENLDDYSGDYLFVYETGNVAFDGGRNNVDDELDATSNTIAVTINDNTIASNTTTDAAKFTIAKVDGGYSIKSASGYYIGWGGEKNGLNTNSSYTVNYLNTISNNTICGKTGYLKFNKTSGQERFRYYQSGQETIALYRKAASYLYTTSPVCGPHLAITEGKDIYVTGGNAGGTRDLVIAQQKVSYKATRLEKDKSTGNLPSIKTLPSNIVFDNTKTKAVAVTFDEDSVRSLQSDGTYTITGNITIAYQPAAANITDDIQVTLNANYNPSADVSQASFTVHARSLPAELVIVAKSNGKWYALNGDMANGSSANPANGQVTLNDDTNPTKATYAPCNTIYTLDGVPNTGDRTRVRFQGTDGAWLWAASGTNVGIQNKSLKEIPEGNNNAYNWKLETDDNITYKFHNDNSSRLLGLSGEKFGMYANAVQEFRILPYEAKCLYNYAPSNLKVSVLKGTYVTLTWDAVAGATKYQYSTNGTTWTDAGTDPTVTINGLEPTMMCTIYIRAYHEDAGVSQECIDYAEITFTTADCDDVPTDITYSADLNSITVSWTAAAPTATIKLYLDENGEHAFFTQNGTTSPWRISTLSKNTTYYLQIFSDGTCASPIIPVKTEDVEVDIVEWDPQGIIVDINTDETIGVTLENEVSYGSGIGTEATELFFSKYYEASYNVKLVAIYNGTKNIIDLTDYTIQYGKTSWETNYITLKDFGATKGQIQPGEEIILYSYTEKNADDKKILDCVHDAFPDGNWVRVTSSNNEGEGIISFAGDKTIILCKTEHDDEADEYYDNIIDVIGALKEDPNEGILPTNENTEKPSWGDDNGWVCETGLSIADDSQIGISTNRCLLVRNNTVTSGLNAVAQNIEGDFVTLCSEWKGAQVPDSDLDNGVAASCENFAYVGTFDYSDYYTKYESMGKGTTFDQNDRNPDGTVTIPITDLYKHACSNIRVKLSNKDGEVLSDREYKVPIMITTTQGTDGEAFIALQQNLATKEVDAEGNVINTYPLSLDEVREICKTCDVVVRDNATLTKVTDGTENDHPQVHDVTVYEGASIVIPDGTDHNYTINSLALRRKGDEVASAQVQGTGKFVLPADVPVTLSMRIDANNWHWFTLPYDCDIADVTWSDGTPAKYNTDWFLMYYDGESRAASTNPHDNHWKVYNGTTIEAGKGYIIGITGDLAHPNYTFELRFPMAQEVLTAEQTDKTVALNAWGVKSDNTPNNKGWNLVGNPYLNYYQPETTGFAGLSLLKYTGINPVTGDRLYDDSGNIPFLVTPIDGGWYEYQQELASDVQMMPFTAYFVQVGDPATHENGQALEASFKPENRAPKSLQARRNASEENSDPAIVAVSLTNAKGESDKTTLLIADRFTNEYEMNADFFKWFGDYYKYYTKPVLYTIGADQGKRAFNALSEDLATQPISLGMYAAQTGNYTFSLNLRNELAQVQEVWLYDATQDVYTNLLQDDYTFHTAKTESAGRFFLSVKMAPKVTTDAENITSGNIWATTNNKTITINGLLSNSQVWVYDAIGKLLDADQTQYFQYSFSVPQTGAYFVRVQNTMQTQTIKVVVE